MSKENVISLLNSCKKDANIFDKFNQKNLPEIILHAKNMGYSFTSEELAEIIGAMEAYIIMNRMGEEINANSSLWPKMWGKSRLEYIITELFNSFSESELKMFLS